MMSFIIRVIAITVEFEPQLPSRIPGFPKRPDFCRVPVAGSGRDAGFLFTYQEPAVELTEERFGSHVSVFTGKYRVFGPISTSNGVISSGRNDTVVQFWDIYYVLRGQLLCLK